MVLKAEKIYFLLLFVFFTLSDILSEYRIANILKFAFMVSILLWTKENKKCRFIQAALLLTCISDFFLLFTPYYTLGVYTFSAVMCIYIYIFSYTHRFYTFPIILNSLFLLSELRLYLLCITYAILFYTNLFIVTEKYSKTKPVLPSAFLLFAVCDVFVALSFLTENSAMQSFVWLFYAPSQYLISHYATK